MKVNIRKGKKEDAPFLSETVMGALGEELCINLAGGKDNLSNVFELFKTLGESSDSQYSFKNAFIAENERSERIGAVIAYDGALLHSLRPAFIREARKFLGWNITEEEAENWEDETSPDEIYIDSLYVLPDYRKHGIATELIKTVFKDYKVSAKPYGILVEPENIRARRLYEKLGFVKDGINCFCGIPMDHLLRPYFDNFN